MNVIKSAALSSTKIIHKGIIISDLFPTNVMLTYNGKDSYKTLFGGIVSIAIQLFALFISIVLMVSIFQRSNSTFTTNKIIKDITYDTTQHYFAQNKDVYFAIRLTGPTPEKLLDKTYFSFNMYQANYKKDNSTQGYSLKYTQIEYELCGSNFPNVQSDIYDRIGLSTYICPKNTDFFCKSKLQF